MAKRNIEFRFALWGHRSLCEWRWRVMRILTDSLGAQDMRTFCPQDVSTLDQTLACGALFVQFWPPDVLNQGLNVNFIPVEIADVP